MPDEDGELLRRLYKLTPAELAEEVQRMCDEPRAGGRRMRLAVKRLLLALLPPKKLDVQQALDHDRRILGCNCTQNRPDLHGHHPRCRLS